MPAALLRPSAERRGPRRGIPQKPELHRLTLRHRLTSLQPLALLHSLTLLHPVTRSRGCRSSSSNAHWGRTEAPATSITRWLPPSPTYSPHLLTHSTCYLGTFYEYNEMAIQFGYLTMFASVAPWAACVCMLVNEVS